MKVGLIWFARDSYPDALQLMLDRETLPQTWDEWHSGARTEYTAGAAGGDELVKVEFDAGEFLAFCIRNGFSTDANGRRKYATFKAEHPEGIPVR